MPPTRRAPAAALLLCALLFSACEAQPPPTREHLILEGDAYARGLRHGTLLRSKIRSFHATILTNTLLPYLNREHEGIASVLPEYRKPRYQNGAFSRELLLDSAKELERQIPTAIREELRGIADGSGLPYDDVLVLNTFPDTVLTVRVIAAAIGLAKAPRLHAVSVEGAETDGRDNDEDGEIDESGEGTVSPWEPSPFAALAQVEPGAALRFVLEDSDGVAPEHLRLIVGAHVFTRESAEVALREITLDGDGTQQRPALEVRFTPSAELTEKARAEGSFTLVLGAGDKALSTSVPVHANFMRQERITLAMAGDRTRRDVANAEPDTGRTQPPSLAFAVRGSSSKSGAPLLAQNFALLDANTAHKHGAVFEHRPSEPGQKPFVVVGWAGMVWGFSGMNAAGLAGACNPSDSLDNSVIARFLDQLGDLDNARLLMRGRPIGIALRRALERKDTAAGGVTELSETQHAAGWSCLFADRAGALRAVEVDSDVSKDGTAVSFGPEAADAENLDPHARPFASNGEDDLRIAAHFRKNTEDMYRLEVLGQRIAPQRYWSNAYYRSVQAWTRLGEALRNAGPLDAESAQTILRTPSLMDVRDSMNSAVFEPATLRYHVAMGQVPAPTSEFETFTLGEGSAGGAP